MEYVFSIKNVLRILIWEEGNRIIINYLEGNKILKGGVLFRDYRTGLCCEAYGDDIYIAYVSVENQLIWSKISDGEPLILYGDASEKWHINNLTIIVNPLGIVLFYEVYNQEEDVTNIKYVLPYGERRGKILLSIPEKIKGYSIMKLGDALYLTYTREGDRVSIFYLMNMERISDITINECVMRDVYLENEKEVREKKHEENLAREMEEKIHNIEKYYRGQYDELSELTKKIQEEGKKWRELYYKSVKKT